MSILALFECRICYYLLGVRSPKVFNVQFIFVKWGQIKYIKRSNIKINQVHQLLKKRQKNVSKSVVVAITKIEPSLEAD